jgi:hypothetical protein
MKIVRPVSVAVMAFATLALPVQARALGEPKYVTQAPSPGSFVLEANGITAPLLVSDADWPGVVRATSDLGQDVQRVTGYPAPVLHRLTDGNRNIVLIGTYSGSVSSILV